MVKDVRKAKISISPGISVDRTQGASITQALISLRLNNLVHTTSIIKVIV